MSAKPSRKSQSIRDKWPNLFKRRASFQPTLSPTPPSSGPSTASPTPLAAEPPDSLAGVSAFGNFIDGHAPQPVAKTVYNGSKILLDIIDKVGYAVPPLKAATAGIGRIMMIVDNVVQNKKDYEAITEKLEAIITITHKYQQHGCQRALDRRIEDLSTAINAHTDKIQRLQERWLIRRAFDNDTDVGLVAKSFRDIGVLLNVFHMDTVLNVEAKIEEMMQRLKPEGEDAIKRLPYAKNASYDTRQAPDNNEPQGCMAGTREQILDELEKWAIDDTAPKVYWLNGMAGTGKTSIAHTLSERLDEKQILGASFFCSRSGSKEVRDASLIIPTIATKLSQASPPLRSAMVRTIEKEPDVGSMHTLSKQFRLLLVDPMKRTLGSSVKTYKIIVIDALDECINLGTVEKLVQSIVDYTPTMPLKFIVASRVTTKIRKAFHHNSEYPPKILSLHDVERTIVHGDIKTYLQNSLSEIVQEGERPLSWPPPDELEILVERSDRLFIYAATAVRYISALDVDFRKRLAHITRLTPARMNTGIIDSLYNDIMEQAFHCELQPDEVSARREILSAVVFLLTPLSLDAITSLLGMDIMEAQVTLAPFRSVIHVPNADTSPVTIFHASFPDFIVDPSRCERHFRLDREEGHGSLAVQCLRCLNQTLKDNIHHLNTNMALLPSQEPNVIPEALRYSCLHWASHLSHALAGSLAQTAVTEIRDLVTEFVEDHLLHWFECLSALRELESGIKSLDIANEAISACLQEHSGFANIAPFLDDARRFLQLNFELIKHQPLQMHGFAHVWIPKKSLMRERYAAALGQTPRVLFGLSQSWQPLVHVIRHVMPVNSVAFSPDGSRLASGSNNIVRIWNTTTGELEDELEGHENLVWSVAFSHNGRFCVSGSWDSTVRIWNTATCETTYILTGHEAEVTSVAISRNDKFVVSGSRDRSVRIWDTATGELLRELKGHGDSVESVAVSPDCQHVASVSHGGELWIWTIDGVIEHKLECLAKEFLYDLAFSNDGRRILCNVNRTEWTTTGHRLSPSDTDNDPGDMGCTWAVAYSSDDREIIYGMGDGGIIIWNRDTNKTHRLGRHSYDVRSVAFSPDGSRIASGSIDETVRIWDPRLRGTINEEASLEELRSVALSRDGEWIVTASLRHRDIQVWRVTETVTKANELIIVDEVWCLAVSGDGSRVVIGCEDGSIWIWNHFTNKKECEMIGHSDLVRSVAISYDGCQVVSGSRDKTVRIWDFHTGNKIALYQHSDWVDCVAFSRSGSRVTFGSYDGIVRIWNPSTGKIDMEPVNETRDWAHSLAFSHDDSHVISGWSSGVWIWNLISNESTPLSGRIQLPDGTRVHSLGIRHFHIYDTVDQEMTNDIPPYLLSISQEHDWIIGEQAGHNCWIPPQYRNFTRAYVSKSIVWLGYESERGIVLDLKSTQRVP